MTVIIGELNVGMEVAVWSFNSGWEIGIIENRYSQFHEGYYNVNIAGTIKKFHRSNIDNRLEQIQKIKNK